ncbi:hypothetical protein KBC55_03015 [Patescibacteria group bacterium]|nr:hypothetical protein [Patescibacteria group bacterium]
MSNAIKKLRALKDAPELGALSASAQEQGKARLFASLGIEESQSPSFMAFPAWATGAFVSRPLAASAASLAVVFGGWMTTVSAAADSLPGDTLYSVKIITEQAQLKLASLDKQAVLHTEFAQRRMYEVAQLQEAAKVDPQKNDYVQGTLEAYKKEVASATQSIQTLQQSAGNSAVLSVAVSVQEKLDVLDDALNATVGAQEGAGEVVSEDVRSAQATIQEAQGVVTEVAVVAHEEEGSQVSEREMREMFMRELGDVQSRQAFNLHRIAKLQGLIASRPEAFTQVAVPTADEFNELTYTADHVLVRIPDAMDSVAAGGFRNAFVILDQIDDALLGLEAQLAAVEFTVVQALAAPVAEVVPEVVETVPLENAGQ